MNRNFYITFFSLLLLFCIFLSPAAFSEDPFSYMKQGIDTLDRAYRNWDKKQFQESLSLFDKAAQAGQKDGLPEYWSGSAHFFMAIHGLFSRTEKTDKNKGAESIKEGIQVLDKAIAVRPDFSENYALRGVLRGMLIKLKPMSAFSQGPKVGKDRKKALELNPENPRVHYLTGVSFWYAPKILGGKDKALEHFLKAEALFEKEKSADKDPLLPCWGQSTCLSFIGDVYVSQKETDKAKEYYTKALSVNADDPLARQGLQKLEKQKKE